jgi:hypothetical protein
VAQVDTTVIDVTGTAARIDAVAAPPRSRGALVAWIIVGVAAMVASLLLLHVGRGTTWFFDDWSWILTRRTGSLDDYLANHNGHLNLVPVLVYKAMWSVFGLTNYTAFRVLAIVVHAGTCVLLFAYLRRRAQLWFAVSATVVILFLGYAFQDLIWPFQIQFTGAMAAGIAALLLLDRRDRAGDVGASIALVVSVACSGVGLPFVGAVTLELLLRRSTWRRLWVPLVPLALWGAWYLQDGQSQVKGSNLHLVPENAAQMGSAAVGALLGVSMDDGHVPLALLGLVVVVVLAIDRRISPRFAGVLALPLGYWILTSLSRAQFGDPAASRYLYPGAIFIVLAVSELVPRLKVPFGRVGATVAVLVLVALVAVSLRGNVDQLRQGAAGLRDASTHVKAELRSVELARARVDPTFRPDELRAPQIDAGGYLEAVDDLGSPADSLRELRAQSAEVRAEADAVLLRALQARLRAAPESAPGPGDAPAVVHAIGGTATNAGACAGFTPSAPDTPDAGLELQTNGPVVVEASTAPVTVGARVIGDAFVPLGTVEPGSDRTVDLPATAAGPWRLQLASTSAFRACVNR